MSTQFLSDKSGKKTHAILTIEDYDDLIDGNDFDELISSDSEVFPSSLVAELLESDVKLPVWRKYRGLTQKQLSDKAGVSAAYIGLLEKGDRSGSIKAISLIASALDIDMDDLIA